MLNNNMLITTMFTTILANMLGIPKAFVKEVYSEIMRKNAFSLVPIILRPKSRGRLRLKSKNPFQWPRMEPNYLSHPDDLNTLVEGAKFVWIYSFWFSFFLLHSNISTLFVQTHRLGESRSFQQYNSKLNPHPYLGCEKYAFASNDYWKCCIKGKGKPLFYIFC